MKLKHLQDLDLKQQNERQKVSGKISQNADLQRKFMPECDGERDEESQTEISFLQINVQILTSDSFHHSTRNANKTKFNLNL